VEVAGQNASTPIDVTAYSTTTSSLTAGSATAFANEYALVFWANADPASPSASGWSTLAASSYDGVLGQAVATSGTTVSMATSTSGYSFILYMATVRP
jgi:hypothetical protein